MASEKRVSSSTNLSGKLAALGVAERNGLFSSAIMQELGCDSA
jgi:hypothetical protein